MMKFSTTSQYRKDIKRIQKQGLDLSLLNIVLEMLLAGKPLPPQYKNHALKGNYIGLQGRNRKATPFFGGRPNLPGVNCMEDNRPDRLRLQRI
jgi:hypothetical protein